MRNIRVDEFHTRILELIRYDDSLHKDFDKKNESFQKTINKKTINARYTMHKRIFFY